MSLKHRHRNSGFTLLEAALTTVIVGTGVLAMVAAQQAYHKKNDWAQRTGTAMLLANELRELTLSLPMHDPFTPNDDFGPEPDEVSVVNFDDLDDFAGVVTDFVGAGITFDPPINALRQPIANMNGWSQTINVVNVLSRHIKSPISQNLGSTNLMRVTVSVSYQPPTSPVAGTVTQLAWLIPR